MVSLTRYACGAADAYMNPRLSKSTRDEFLKAYNRYDFKARMKLWQAVYEFDEKVRRGDSVDVLPLYIATFLHHAAGVSCVLLKQGFANIDRVFFQACIRGDIDIDAATAAFDYYNNFTAMFPIVIRRSPTSDGGWGVDMLVSFPNLPRFHEFDSW